jgi:hypothetical protein
MDWPVVVLILGLFVVGVPTIAEMYKTRVRAGQDEDMRQLISRYEKLAENSMDAQQRIATDVAELRTRAAAIEQILRTVE